MKIQENDNGPKLVRFDTLSCGNVFRYSNDICMKISAVTEECTGDRVTAVGLYDGLRWVLVASDMVENLSERATLVID